MAVFAVIASSPAFSSELLEKAVKEQFPQTHYEVAPGQYLVSAEKMTASQVMEKLGIGAGALGRVLILRVSSYQGWHAKDMWEWIAAQVAPPTPPAPDPPGSGNE